MAWRPPPTKRSYFQHYFFIQNGDFLLILKVLSQHWHLIIWRLILSLPYTSLFWLNCGSEHNLTRTANKNNAALGHICFTDLRSSIWWQVSPNRMSQDMLKMWAILGISCVQSKEIARRKPSTESVDMSVYNFVRFLIFCYNLIGISVCLKNRRNHN